jgi:probable phosphoglycerate mutase
MTTFYLIRHGNNDGIPHGGLSGRMPGIHLNASGGAQAQALAERLKESGIARVYHSPIERARETAEPLAARLSVPLCALDGVTEVDFGEWTGWSFAQLEKDPRWRAFNRMRSITRIPGGELMLEIQSRVVTSLERLRHEHPQERIAVVSHGDPIRAALVFYLGVPIDLMHGIHIDTASVSIVSADDGGVAVRCLNHTGPVPI